MDGIDSNTLAWAGAGLLLVIVAYWILYRVVRAAVRAGVRESGLAGRGIPFMPRKEEDSAHDFVFTEPRY